MWCLAAPSSATHLSGKSEYFYYSPESHGCQRVEAGCAPAANCSFTSRQECHSVCITARAHVIGGCESTKYGCCGDGVTVNDGQNNCPGTCPRILGRSFYSSPWSFLYPLHNQRSFIVHCVPPSVGEAESTASSAGQPSIGVHWGLLASGVCGAVLLLGVVTVVGLSTFAYRKRHRNRQRW